MDRLASHIKSYQARAYTQTHGPALPLPRFFELRQRGNRRFIKIQREGATQWTEGTCYPYVPLYFTPGSFADKMRPDAETYFRSPALLGSICGVYGLGFHALCMPLRSLRKVKNDYLQLQVQVLETTLRLQKVEVRALRAKTRYYRQEIKRMEEEWMIVEENTDR